MLVSDPRSVLDWFEALSERPDDDELRRRAARAASGPPPVGTTLRAALLGGPGAYFLGAEDWLRWVRFLRREPPERTALRSGWVALSYSDRPVVGSVVDVLPGWPGALSSVLGPPERGHDDFLPYEAWCVQDPAGRRVLVHRYLAPEGGSPGVLWVRCFGVEGVETRLAELLAVDRPEHWRSGEHPLAERFVVRRGDDRAEVSRHATRAAAELRAARLGAEGRRCWVE